MGAAVGFRRIGLVVLGTAGLHASGVLADAKDQLTGQGGVAVPLQQVIRNERARGPIFVAVPGAYVFGLSGERNATYCSPSVRAGNSSNSAVEELVIGIDYQTKAGQAAGASVTRFGQIKVGHQDTHYFYQLAVNDCRGLEGQVQIIRCVYTSGVDCTRDVQVIGYGTIPLRLKPLSSREIR